MTILDAKFRQIPATQELHPPKIGSGIDPFPNVPFTLLDQKESISLRDIYTLNKSQITLKSPINYQLCGK
jgi:hypothetical protein